MKNERAAESQKKIKISCPIGLTGRRVDIMITPIEWRSDLDYQFFEVTGEDGKFYDLVKPSLIDDYTEDMINDGFQIKKINQVDIPPCICRVFDDTASRYHECTYMMGEDFYF